ncbi:atrial natriuretic peptide-converting enzyme isoform X1 [Papilio machaon]|uniref:atrial natriuretic peptide-converting enzyme isoform X1 n=2 Tax=Papilio machaon TaxID=76193 RepID=UPI001E66490E|nr:atrial natriuretic peptide-converting enzyme isoform X1 [Papilio machaon]
MTFSGNMESKPRNAKESWESELGYGWTRSGQRRCRGHRPPESTMSVSSDIRFTRRKLSRPCRGCCAALAALLVLLLLAAVAVYLGHMYLFGDPLNRQTFRGSFVVTSWGETGEEENDLEVKNTTREYDLRQALHDAYSNSELRSCFVGAEILALDSADEGERVHFEVSFEPIFTAVGTPDVTDVMDRQLRSPTGYFSTITVLPDTLHIEESSVISSQALTESDSLEEEATTTEMISFELVEEVRECAPLTLPLCSHLPYNITTYPNLVAHPSKEVLMRDLVAFRELLDAECSHLAQDFVCQMLQPQCSDGRLVRPCRAYCRAFHAGCGARLPERLRAHFDCARFPDYFGPGSCAPEPDCNGGLRRLALSRRACDGVPDCADAAEERGCAHCTAAGQGALRCALHPRCLPQQHRCDGIPHCPDASDEAGCLWVSRSLASWKRETRESTLGARRSRGGYAVWAERGHTGKICAAPYEDDKKALMNVANSLCKVLTFTSAISADAVLDGEVEGEYKTDENKEQPEYVEVVDPSAAEISFVKSECPERRVLKVVCDQLECGLASARGREAGSGAAGLPRAARPGDWPWHAALLRANVHVCDGVLLHPNWLLTTASCFQGQPKAEWTARFGTVRIQSTSPWQQERRIIGLVRSPVEGSMLALVRLEEPVEMTDFVRPTCLPEGGMNNQSTCNSLGWTRNRDQLQRIHVVPTAMQSCENVSIATTNGICAEPLYDKDDCDEEEYAGSSMMCFDENSKRWSLAGVSGWRIACSKIGLGRPRIYDAVSSHVDWIQKTISNSAR